MHQQRLVTLAALAALAAVPEALINHSDAAVGFQTWMVLQLLGVIVVALAVAAAFSVLGLGLVRLFSWPLRDRPSTFVAWSFLRAARITEPLPTRLLRRVRDALDAGPLAPTSGGLAKLAVAGVCLGAGALCWQLSLALGGGSLGRGLLALFARNFGVVAALHAVLLIAAAPPWRPLRWALPALAALALLGGIAALALVPELGGRFPFVALAAGVAAGVALVAAVLRRPRHGRERVARRAGLIVLLATLAGVGMAAAALPTSLGAQVAAAGLALGLAAVYLLLHGQARVSVPVFVAIVGVAAGTWALIVVLSVMGGFAADLRSKMLVANAHALVERPGGAAPIVHAARLAAALRGVEGVVAVSPQVRGDAILGSAFNVHNFVSLRGIDPGLPEVQRGVGSTVVSGSLALLSRPEAMGRSSYFARRTATSPRDVPQVPGLAADASATAAPNDGVDDADIDALLQLAPGPASAPTPRPALLLPSDAADTAALPAAATAADVGGDLLDVIGLDADGGLGGSGGSGAATLGEPDLGGGLGRLLDLPLVDEERDVPVAPGILLGVELANSLQVDLGDRVEVITPDADVGPTGLRPRLRTFRVAGTFETGLYEADSKVAYVDVAEASRYFNLDGAVNVIELRLAQPAEPDGAIAAARAALAAAGAPADLRVVDWREINRSLFSALAFERLVIFLVLGLIILVASFAIVSALTMVILQKKSGIAMLAAMGATPRLIAAAFVQMGVVIGAIGTTAGLVLGLGTCFLIDTLGIQLPDAYYVRTLPVEVAPAEVTAVVLAALAVSLVATAFPARTAARSRPLEGLRHD